MRPRHASLIGSGPRSISGGLAMLAAMRRACRVPLWLACATPFHRPRACYIFSAVRDHILSEIRRLAGANGGHPPGRRSFAKITGIRESAWFGHYWPRWGDALIEAGFAPNTPPERLDEGHVFSKLAAACRHFGRFPVTKEMRMYKKVDADFPNEKSVISGFGNVAALKHRFAEWGRNNPGYEDVAAMVSESSSQPSTAAVSIEGFVYLIRSGAHYKIGRSDELEADPNYVPPGTHSKKTTQHRVIRAPRARTSRRFEPYSVNPAFPYRYCYCCNY